MRELPRKVRKAVFPVAGLGTRFLPATKALPKEMLPIVDRPLIQYAVDEALAAGIRELIFVTHRSKRAIEDYFDRALEIERELASKGRHGQLNELRRLVAGAGTHRLRAPERAARARPRDPVRAPPDRR